MTQTDLFAITPLEPDFKKTTYCICTGLDYGVEYKDGKCTKCGGSGIVAIKRARKSDPASSHIAAAEIEERFQKHVEPEPTSGCHLWTGVLNSTGYGQFRIGRRADANAMTVLAHRVAWNLYRGRIPFGMHVLHRCDTPACVNPDHLFLGTHMDNHHDKAMKGRGARSRRGLPFGVQPVRGCPDKWQACVALAGKKHYLGCFGSIQEASAAALQFKPVANPMPGGRP